MTVTLLACGLGLTLGAAAVDATTADLLADVRLALKRADLSLDYVARCIGIHYSKLSRQLAGDEPFTLCWRILASSEIRQTEFWPEFLALRAARVDRAVVSSTLGQLVASVSELVAATKKPMAKMELPAIELNAKVG